MQITANVLITLVTMAFSAQGFHDKNTCSFKEYMLKQRIENQLRQDYEQKMEKHIQEKKKEMRIEIMQEIAKSPDCEPDRLRARALVTSIRNNLTQIFGHLSSRYTCTAEDLVSNSRRNLNDLDNLLRKNGMFRVIPRYLQLKPERHEFEIPRRGSIREKVQWWEKRGRIKNSRYSITEEEYTKFQQYLVECKARSQDENPDTKRIKLFRGLPVPMRKMKIEKHSTPSTVKEAISKPPVEDSKNFVSDDHVGSADSSYFECFRVIFKGLGISPKSETPSEERETLLEPEFSKDK